MTPDLSTYDIILVNTSGGKDSQAMLSHVHGLALAAGVEERLVAVHADLGRAEWEGTRALAERQAVLLGVRFEVVSREQDLLAHVQARGMWPSSRARYCTSDHKRDQVAKVVTRLVNGWPYPPQAGSRLRVLNCLGLRAQESPARAKRAPYAPNVRLTNGKRTVADWSPLHAWTVEQVWAEIKRSGLPYHYAYDLGMPRLSCVFCIFAPRAALVLAARHNPALMAEYVAIERAIGHTFRVDLSLAEVSTAALGDAPPAERIESWTM